MDAKRFIINSEYSFLPKEHGELLRLLDEYLSNGGFPDVVISNLDAKDYLKVLFDSVLFKDVVKRYNVKFSTQISNLGSHLINNFASLYSLRKLQNILNFKSVTTTEKYTKYLEEAYLVFSLLLYSPKSAQRIKSPKKIYVVDNGFISAKAIQHSPDKGKLLENLVFIELVKRGVKPNFDLFYYKTRNAKEVDFILREGLNVKTLIQVAYQVDEMGVKEREMKALVEASGELKCNDLIVLTWDYEREEKISKKKIKFVPVWKWLLE